MLSENPRVSFIMPAFNVGELITKSVESILRQTDQNWELIIINDGSTDNTLAEIKKYVNIDARIRLINLENASGGAFFPRKIGIQNARADLIAPIDADDFIEANYLEELNKLMEETGADLVYPTMYFYSGKESSLYTPKDSSLFNRAFTGKECIKLTLFKWQIGANGGLIKKQIYEKAYQTIDPEINYSCADEFLTRHLLLLAEKVSFSPSKYYYRINPDSVTKKKSLKNFDIIENNIRLIEFIEKNFSKNSQEYILMQRQNLHDIFRSLRILNDNKFSKENQNIIFKKLKPAKNKIDYEILERYEKKKYLFLSRLSLSGIQQTFKITGMIKTFFKKSDQSSPEKCQK